MKIRRMWERDDENQRGATLVLVALLLFVFLGVAALAIDIGHIVVVRNELQNAADAGALAGAADLYFPNPPPAGQTPGCLNTGASTTAATTATSNLSAKVAVEVNGGDVVVGNWNPTTNTFTQRPFPGTCTDPVLPINAVRVTTRRQSTPVPYFFALIWEGMTSFSSQTSATAWIGPVGPPMAAGEFDQPIVICQQSLTNGCNIGRMINSGSNVQTSNTGGWTDFNQTQECRGAASNSDVRKVICSQGNPAPVQAGPIPTNGGQMEAIQELRKCWENETNKTQPWMLTLPVVDCPGNNLGPCSNVVGAVQVEVVWITGQGEDPDYNEAPYQMGTWSSSDPIGLNRWNSFVSFYSLRNVDSTNAPYQKKAIYFKPTCEITQISGITGGNGFNVVAGSPALVQ